jgi:putative DNA primase/helicase
MADRDDLVSIKDALTERAEELCLDLFGTPTSKARHEWRWGRKGSLKLRLRGKGAPSIFDFSAGRGGSMLDAIALAHDFHRLADAVSWARNWLGKPETERRKVKPRRNDAPDPEADGERHARAIWDASCPIAGTPAEAYLRGRDIEAETWPTSVRWNANARCIVFASIAPDGRHTAIQRVFLHPDGTPVTEDDGKGGRRKIKRSRGPRYGGAVHFKGYSRPDVLILAEGPETALSIWHATGVETWATIGPVHTVNLDPVPINRTILVALDDDARNAQVRKHTNAAVMRWRKQGRTVLTALPWPSTRRDKSDFNDALKQRGPAYVTEMIDAALKPKQKPGTTLTLNEAHAALDAAMDEAMAELLAPRDDCFMNSVSAIALKVSTGTGKTRSALRAVIQRMIDGDLRNATYAVPDNELSAELVDRAIAIRDELGGTFEIGSWRGREAVNPEAFNEAMCHRPDVVRAVSRAGLDVQTTVCRTREGSECPFYSACAYQAQRRQRRRLTITNHAAVFTKKAKGIPTPGLLVIDEGFLSQGLTGTDRKILTPRTELTGSIKINRQHGRDLFGNSQARAEADAMADLEPVREKLRHILDAAPQGPLRRHHIEAAGLTPELCRDAAKAEGRRLVVPRISPDMTEAEIIRRLEGAAVNAGCMRRAALLDAIAEFIATDAEASGHVLIDRTKDGEAAFRSLGRRPLGDGWNAPTLILNATLRVELVKPWFPNIRVAAEIEAETPNMRVVQHYSRSFAKSHFRDRDATGPWTADRKAVSRLWTWCRAEIQKTDGSALVVVQKAIEEDIRTGFRVPPHIDLAHHNAVAGKDGWRTVSTLVSVGRTLPPPEAVEAVAMALSGQWIDPAVLPIDDKGRRWYAAAAHPVADRAGNVITLTAEHHPNSLAEQVRAAIAEDELVQIMGRARGVNRGPNNPVVVHILADLPLPVTVDEFRQWDPPGLDAAMLTEGAWTESAEDAARLWPGIIKTPMTLKNARRGQSVLFSSEYINNENYTHCTRLTYQKHGPRQRPVAAIIDRRLIPDPEQWLRDRLGPVKVVFLDANAPMVRKTRAKAAKAATEAVQVDPAPTACPPPEAVPALPEAYSCGTLPETMTIQIRRRLRELGFRHEDAARAVGLSRPQFTNILNGTFGLSPDAARRLAEFMDRPPDGPIQPDFLTH